MQSTGDPGGVPAKEEILEREARWARPAGIGGVLGAIAIAASLVIAGKAIGGGTSDAEALRNIHDSTGTLLAAYALRGIGLLLLALPVAYLFQAARARSPQVRAGILRVIVVGAVLLTVSAGLEYGGTRQAADDFVREVPASTPTPKQEDQADHIQKDNSLRSFSASLALAGAVGFGLSTLYAALWGTRTGLLRRLFGTLGTASGAVFVLIPFFLMIWIAYLGLLILGFVPRGRPPAWAAGEATPWEPREGGGGGPFSFGQPRDEGVIEGSGQEIETDAGELPDGGDGEIADQQPPAETQGQRRKKRKRRS